VSPDEASYAVLLAKHPDAPDDRRASPSPTIDSMSCLVPQLLLAIKSAQDQRRDLMVSAHSTCMT